MKRTQLYIDPATYQLALDQAKRQGTSVSDVIRRSIKHYVEPKLPPKQRRQEFLKWLDAFNKKYPTPPGTPPDLGLEHDHYLYGTPKKYAKK
ncbi:hypothetical protein HY086_00395 [Candidatus Gottesmanbacteria bacterium]|nr:hypothetical protein [Candidatus Gottesmanbacteria bacterium]